LLADERRVGVALMASFNREHLLRALPVGSAAHAFVEARPFLGLPAGTAGSAADVRAEAGLKRCALLAHVSQLRAGSLVETFATLCNEDFKAALGHEWLAQLRGAEAPDFYTRAADLFSLSKGAILTRAL
jgi:hypothetical protein